MEQGAADLLYSSLSAHERHQGVQAVALRTLVLLTEDGKAVCTCVCVSVCVCVMDISTFECDVCEHMHFSTLKTILCARTLGINLTPTPSPALSLSRCHLAMHRRHLEKNRIY